MSLVTRLPVENRDFQGVEYCPQFPKFKVGPLCCVPGCSKLADHAHHIIRRSALAGDYGWVRLHDGTVIQNLCGLCYLHHNDVTENRAWIEFRDATFFWNDSQYRDLFLDPQPKIWGVTSDTPEETPREHAHAPGAVESCPTCSRPLPRPRGKREAARARERWSITVPKDEREKGADVLDTLLEEAAKITGHDQENDKTRYHSLSFALGMFVLHGEELMGDG